MQLSRILRHLILPHWWSMRAFPTATLQAIEKAVGASEGQHQGELRFVVESGLPLRALLHNQTPRARAIELFARERVWDTADNCGVLIYLQLVDRRVEIVADRGIDTRVGPPFWSAVCRRMEAAFREERFEAGVLNALEEITAALTTHFPAGASKRDELPNQPLVL